MQERLTQSLLVLWNVNALALTFSPDQKTLFLSIQHPGEKYGLRQNFNADMREFELLTTNGNTFKQKRTVPLGSNWPGKAIDSPPRPAVVAIRALDETVMSQSG